MKKILIAYDGSETSNKAVDVATSCASKEDEIVLLTVIPAELIESSFTRMLLPTIDLSQMVKPGTFKEKARKSLKPIANGIKDKVKAVEIVVEDGDAADEILLTAKRYGCNVIAIGYKGYGKEGRFLIGSVADKVIRYASVSVLIVR